MTQDMNQLTEEVKLAHTQIAQLYEEIDKVVVGQKYMIERLLMGVLMGGHILVEGVPGLAKTTAVKALADVMAASFQRLQFTPDLLPADLLGTQIYNPKTQEFFIKKGPLFHNIILADEINRAPAKVQSALLEAMQEKQITIGDETFRLEEPFIVLATQNPIEQEGTYPLPEAQLDRFMLKLNISYPSRDEELKIMKRFSRKAFHEPQRLLDPAMALKLGELVSKIYIDPKIDDYIISLVFATREPKTLKGNIERYIQYGASPRASIYLHKASRCYAFLMGRAYVVPQDVKTMCLDVLRHRIILTYEAEAEGLTTDDVIKKILDRVDVP
ncbi:MAG: MoxR family ATPase [Deltaproteobacteria bacterium]|nr:MoxR family ATPase [Deltaproteobacteria bacterium]